MAVLGDSDSHSYQDSETFPRGGSARGGLFRATTFQWVDVLARLRPNEVDLGPWQLFGERRSWVADIWRGLGRPSRHPRKEDYLFNMAISGAKCDHLLNGPRRQVPGLLAHMDRNAQRWRSGVVVIRIGINDLGDVGTLDALTANPYDAAVAAKSTACLQAVERSVEEIRSRHPETAILLVGLFNNVHWARNLDRWQDARALANIDAGLADFDNGLRRLAARTPRTTFFDDQAWFRSHWGDRAPDGRPAYRPVRLGKTFEVRISEGDHPAHAYIADGHVGTVWNGLWAQSILQTMAGAWGMHVTPISAEEISRLADPDGRFGMRH